jgi:hypothetical protein
MSTRHLMPFGILPVILALLMLIPSSRAAPLEASQLADQVWVRLGGPPGGLGYDIRMSYSDPDVMFVTDAMAGIHKSTDRGRTWYITNEGTDLRQGQSGDIIPVFSATVDPNNSA